MTGVVLCLALVGIALLALIATFLEDHAGVGGAVPPSPDPAFADPAWLDEIDWPWPHNKEAPAAGSTAPSA